MFKIFDTIKNEPIPLFIIGSGRSGTTLLQRILNSVEGVYIWGEHGGFLKSIANSYYKFETNFFLSNLESLKKGNENNLFFLKRLKNTEVWSAWTNFFKKEDIKRIFRNFVKSFFLFKKEDINYYGFKEIRYGLAENSLLKSNNDKVMDFLHDIFPEAKFIFIVRNPLDVIASQISVFKKNDKKELMRFVNKWKIQNENLFNFYTKNNDNCFLIKYEDLINKKCPHLNKLFEFLNLNLKEEQFLVLDSKKGRGEDINRNQRHTLLTKKEIISIIKLVQKTANCFGYELTEDYFLNKINKESKSI